jgi:hypothetical protein
LERANCELPRIVAADQEERVMQSIDEHREDHLIDLGAVTEETKGGSIVSNDSAGQQQGLPGLSDD